MKQKLTYVDNNDIIRYIDDNKIYVPNYEGKNDKLDIAIQNYSEKYGITDMRCIVCSITRNYNKCKKGGISYDADCVNCGSSKNVKRQRYKMEGDIIVRYSCLKCCPTGNWDDGYFDEK